MIALDSLPENDEYPPRDQIELLDVWDLRIGEIDGYTFITIFNTHAEPLVGHPDYPFQAGIKVLLNKPREGDFTIALQADQFYKIEDLIRDDFMRENASLFIGMIITPGMTEYVLYTTSRNVIKKQFRRLCKRISTHEMRLEVQSDKNWSVYKRFTSKN